MAKASKTTYPQMLVAAFEGVADAVVIVDYAGVIVLVNDGAENLFGYAREQLLGQKIEMLMPASFAKRHVQHREVYSRSPHERPMGWASMPLYGRRQDGSEFPVEVSLRPAQAGTKPVVVSIIHDASETNKPLFKSDT